MQNEHRVSPLLRCSAIGDVCDKTVRLLKETGGIGLKVTIDKKTKEPVFYIWQSFTFVRLDAAQARDLAREITRKLRQHAPPKASKKRGT